MSRLLLQFLSLLIATTGCDKPDAPIASRSATKPAGFGSIHGKVTLSGYKLPPPPPNMVKCANHDIAITDQTILLNPNATLRNVILYLKNAPPGATTATPAPAALDQINCSYNP